MGAGENNRRQFEYSEKDRGNQPLKSVYCFFLCVSVLFPPLHLCLPLSDSPSYSFFFFFNQSLISNLFSHITFKLSAHADEQIIKCFILACTPFIIFKNSPMIQNEM